MNRTPLVVIIVGIAVLTAMLDFLIPVELAGSALFAFPIVLCILRPSKWLLWATAAITALSSVAAQIWGFRPIALPSPWVAPVSRGLLITVLLAVTALIHVWMNKSQKAMLDTEEMERHSNDLQARNEQLEIQLAKIKSANKAKRKPIVLTIKQYQAFAGQLSDLHRTMVVAAMCSGMRVSEVLGLRWDQLDLENGLLFIQPQVANGGTVRKEGSDGPHPMDPVLLESLLEWRKKTSGSGLVFPSHITGRCYYAGPIQQDYFRPAARKLGLVGVSWHTFPHSYRSWMDEDGTTMGVQQKLLRHASVATNTHNHGSTASKPKAKANGKPVRPVSAASGFREDLSADAP
ncbi:MAG: site-specific integrase [Acidobacteriaceae bacterium]|jgi:integrase